VKTARKAGASQSQRTAGFCHPVSFESTELGRSDDGEHEGAVSSVIVAYNVPLTLPPRSTLPLCRLTVEGRTPSPAAESKSRLYFVDGLRGSGQPLTNNVTFRGSSRRPETFHQEVLLTSGVVPFTRGDANSDGRLDLSDGIAIVRYLFLDGDEPGCLAAGDTDDNGRLELTDAVIIASFLFTGGPPPVAPGPDHCSVDETPDALGCLASTSCD